MLTIDGDGDRCAWIEPVPRRDLAECKHGKVVTLAGCIDAYVDAESRARKDDVCWRCPVGRARRVELADGFEETPPRHGGRPITSGQGRKSPMAWATFRGVHLLETVRAVLPGTTALELRRWIEERDWPTVGSFREKLAERLGVTRSMVVWR